jgi:hypothetical protein
MGNFMSLIIEPVDAKGISLTEFVTLLVLKLQESGAPMPFQNEEKWHELFYSLKMKRDEPGRPAFLDKLRFDWDGRYPKALDLSECLQTLHWNGFLSVGNPTYDTLRVDPDVAKHQDKIRPNVQDAHLKGFVDNSAQVASKLFS